MKSQINALLAEFSKNRHSSILWVTFAAFALAPLMGGVFMIMVKNPELLAKSGALKQKAIMAGFEASWDSYFDILSQAIGVGGVLVFGFVVSWIFGREYSDGTAKDLLALPVSRAKIVNAKFINYIIWCLGLVISNLLFGWVLGSLLGLEWKGKANLDEVLSTYFITSVLTIAIGTPIAFFALYGRGYLAPLGFVALTLVLAQIIAATGFGTYFPWAIPGLFSGAGGEFKELLKPTSYFVLALTSLAGYAATLYWWNYADQSK